MASKNTSSSPNGRQKVQRSNSDSARWVAGLLLLFIGVFAASAVLFSFFTWAADQSGLLLSPEERATLGVEPGNLCGWAGARLGRLLVDNSFGVSGILIPVMVVLVGVRVIRQRPLDAIQEECFLLDMMSIQIILELFEYVCRHLECNGSGFCTAHPLFHLCLIKCCDQPSHVFAQALPGLFLMFPDLSVQVYRDLRTQIFCVCHICVLLSD